MSTPTTPGIFTAPAGGTYPNLTGLKLPKQLVNGMTDIYSLVYSLRDTVNQQAQTIARMVQYGTDSQRTQTNPQAVPNGALWYETDTGDLFQSQLSAQSTTRQWAGLETGGAAGPAGPQGPQGPPGILSLTAHNVTSQRTLGVNYPNAQSTTMLVTAVCNLAANVLAVGYVDGLEIDAAGCTVAGVGGISLPVPPGSAYQVGLSGGSGGVVTWVEWY